MANGGSHKPQKPGKPQQDQATQQPKAEQRNPESLPTMNRIDANRVSLHDEAAGCFL